MRHPAVPRAMAALVAVLAAGATAAPGRAAVVGQTATVAVPVTLDRTPYRRAEILNGVDQRHRHRAAIIATNRQPFVLMTRLLPKLKAGETLSIAAESEVTNEVSLGKRNGFDINVPAWAQVTLLLTSSRTATTGIVLHRFPAVQITPEEHHHVFAYTFSGRLARAYGNRYLTEVVRSWLPVSHPHCVLRNIHGRTPPGNPGVAIPCAVVGEPGYGTLSVLRQGAATWLAGGRAVRPPLRISTLRWSSAAPSQVLTPGPRRLFVAVYAGRVQRSDILSVGASLGMSIDGRSRDAAACIAMVGTQLWLSSSPRLPPRSSEPIDSGTAYNLSTMTPFSPSLKVGSISAGQSYPGGAWIVARAWSLPPSSTCVNRTPLSMVPSRSSVIVSVYRSARR